MPGKDPRRPFTPANRTNGRGFPIVTIVACTLLIMCLVFIGYSWNAGLLGNSKMIHEKKSEVIESLSKSESFNNKKKILLA